MRIFLIAISPPFTFVQEKVYESCFNLAVALNLWKSISAQLCSFLVSMVEADFLAHLEKLDECLRTLHV